MLQEKAGIDLIDVDLSPQEAFALVDEPQKETEPEQLGESEQKAESGEKDDGKEKDEGHNGEDRSPSRYEKRINKLILRAKDAEEKLAAVEAAREVEHQRAEEERSAKEATSELSEFDERLAAIDKRIDEESDDPSMQEVLRTQKLLLNREKSRAPKTVEKEQEPPQRREREQPQRQEVHPSAKKWLDANAWYTELDESERQKYPALLHVAESEYHNLKQFGDDSEELFQELDRRLKEYPEFDRILKKEKEPEKTPDRPSRQNTSPTAARAMDDEESPLSAREPKLDKHDKAKLRALGQDPDDPKVRKAYIKYNPRKFKGAA